MKSVHFLALIALLFVFNGCSKSSNNSVSAMGTTTGATGGTGTTTTPYVVKTVGVSGFAVSTSVVDGKLIATSTDYSDGAGNYIRLTNAGTDLTVVSVNTSNPTVTMDGTVPVVNFPNNVKIVSDTNPVVAKDSETVATVKIMGIKNQPFNQLNIILIKDKTLAAGTVRYRTEPAQSLMTATNIQNSLNWKATTLAITVQ